jgi:hypothetical protein
MKQETAAGFNPNRVASPTRHFAALNSIGDSPYSFFASKRYIFPGAL